MRLACFAHVRSLGSGALLDRNLETAQLGEFCSSRAKDWCSEQGAICYPLLRITGPVLCPRARSTNMANASL